MTMPTLLLAPTLAVGNRWLLAQAIRPDDIQVVTKYTQVVGTTRDDWAQALVLTVPTDWWQNHANKKTRSQYNKVLTYIQVKKMAPVTKVVLSSVTWKALGGEQDELTAKAQKPQGSEFGSKY